MITEILSQDEISFTLSVKADDCNEYWGRPLLFSKILGVSIEDQIKEILKSVIVPVVDSEVIPMVVDPVVADSNPILTSTKKTSGV